MELNEQWANIPTEYAEKKIDRLTKTLDNLKSHADMASGGGSKLANYAKMQTWDYENAVNNIEETNIKRETELRSNVTTTSSTLETAKTKTEAAEVKDV